MSNFICPKCREENPPEAVMCWACYTPLGNGKIPSVQLSPEEPEIPFSSTKWKNVAEAAAPYLLLGALVSSGWWKGKTRFAVLGACLGTMTALWAWEKRPVASKDRNGQDPRNVESPIFRITDTILLYALKDGASHIQITLHPLGVNVKYLIGDDWHEQMRMPKYIWASLKNELTIRATSGAIHFNKEGENANFTLRILIEPPHEEISLTRL